MKDQIKATIEAHADELTDISRWMFENPEVAYEERAVNDEAQFGDIPQRMAS